MIEQRFVLDTNVTVGAAVLPKSVPRQAFNKALDLGSPLLSGSIVVELVEVLGRKRFDRSTSRENRDRFLVTLIERALSRAFEIRFESVAIPRTTSSSSWLSLGKRLASSPEMTTYWCWIPSMEFRS